MIDRECILRWAKERRVCPFEYSLDIASWVDHIICDYNYVFDPQAHIKRFFSESGKEEYLFLIDEAHNLVERGRPMTIHGSGQNLRSFLYVKDIAEAFDLILHKGRVGEIYNIGGHNEKKNIEVVKTVCALLDELAPRKDGKPYAEQIVHVKDRPGHDLRYAIDPSKIARELGWKPAETFESGIRKTVEWYLAHRNDWCAHVLSGTYKMERLGTGGAQ